MSRFRTRKIRGLCRPQHLPRLRQRTFEALEGLLHHVGRHPVADCRVGVPAVVAGLYEADHGEDRLLARGRRAAVVHLALRVAKRGSATALSWQPPVPPQASLTSFPWPTTPKASRCAGCCGRLEDGPSALWPRLRASPGAGGLCRWSCARTHAHPATMRALRPTTVARDSQPCPVRR